jgi:UDP-N-acetylglucosamine 1-carboxyvinyltransferase
MSEGSNTVGDKIVASHSGPLSGEVVIPGAKNSVLKLMAATLLADGRYLLTNAPVIVDVDIMADLLTAVGLSITFHPAGPGEVGQHIEIVNSGAITPVAPFEPHSCVRESGGAVVGSLWRH